MGYGVLDMLLKYYFIQHSYLTRATSDRVLFLLPVLLSYLYGVCNVFVAIFIC